MREHLVSTGFLLVELWWAVDVGDERWTDDDGCEQTEHKLTKQTNTKMLLTNIYFEDGTYFLNIFKIWIDAIF